MPPPMKPTKRCIEQAVQLCHGATAPQLGWHMPQNQRSKAGSGLPQYAQGSAGAAICGGCSRAAAVAAAAAAGCQGGPAGTERPTGGLLHPLGAAEPAAEAWRAES